MPLKIEQKKHIVSEVSDVAGKALSALAADYRGLSVSQMTELRAKGRETGVHIQVVRNTLARRAVVDTDFACLDQALVGPIVLMFSLEDPGAAARLVRDFIKENGALEVKALALSGQLMDASALAQIADLPTYDQAVATTMMLMLAPVTQVARALSETYAKLVRVTAAVAEQKQ